MPLHTWIGKVDFRESITLNDCHAIIIGDIYRTKEGKEDSHLVSLEYHLAVGILPSVAIEEAYVCTYSTSNAIENDL